MSKVQGFERDSAYEFLRQSVLGSIFNIRSCVTEVLAGAASRWPWAPNSRGATLFAEHLEFPITYPKGYADHILMIDDQIPALALTPQLCQTMQRFLQATTHIERTESV